MKKSTVIVPKASSYNFDNTTMYNMYEKLEIDLITEKFYRSLRPKPANPLGEPISKTHKNLSIPFFDPGREVIRSGNEKLHNNCLPDYVQPYYNIKETGFSNMNHNNIFRKD